MKVTKTNIDMLEIIAEKYKSYQWTVVYPPLGCLFDIIAQRSKKLHFVKIISIDKKYSEEYYEALKNSFVQNAFSNMAVPIYAYINNGKIKLVDINQNIVVQLRNLKTKKLINTPNCTHTFKK